MTLGCVVGLFVGFGLSILAAYLHASLWWLLPIAIYFAFMNRWTLTLNQLSQRFTFGMVIAVIVIPIGGAFLVQWGIYWLATRFLFS